MVVCTRAPSAWAVPPGSQAEDPMARSEGRWSDVSGQSFRYLKADRAEGTDKYLLDTEMMEQAGWCYEFEEQALAERVGAKGVSESIGGLIHQAMDAWASEDLANGLERTYSVWVGQMPGVGRYNQEATLALAYVVEHVAARCKDEEGDEPERDVDRPTPFDELLQTMPEFVRVESATPIWDGARPWYLVRGNSVARIDGDSEQFQIVADAVVADFWQGQLMLDEVGGPYAYVETDSLQMRRGAQAYLRHFVRNRRVFHAADMPADSPGTPAPTWLQEYFDSSGELFHTLDWRRNHETILLALTQEPALYLGAPVRYCLDLRVDERRLSQFLILEDPEQGDLASEFIYSLDSLGHLEELASLATQDAVRVYVYDLGNGGAARLVGVREVTFPADEAERFAQAIARIVRAFADSAKMLPSEDVADVEAEPEVDVEVALAALGNREDRAWGVQELCKTRDPAFIEPVIKTVQKMAWEEVDSVCFLLPLLGEEVIEHLVEMTTASKKSTAACGMRALGLMRSERSLEVLVGLAKSLSSKGEPFEALVDLGEYALPSLHELSQDSHAEVREMAAYAMGKIGCADSRVGLAEMVEGDRSGKVKEMAARALRWVDGEEECDADFRDFYGNVARVERTLLEDEEPSE